MTACGLNRCKGLSEAQRLLWVLSIRCTACAKVKNFTQQLTSVKHSTSEKHKDLLVKIASEIARNGLIFFYVLNINACTCFRKLSALL